MTAEPSDDYRIVILGSEGEDNQNKDVQALKLMHLLARPLRTIPNLNET